jgi:hypothetical protein
MRQEAGPLGVWFTISNIFINCPHPPQISFNRAPAPLPTYDSRVNTVLRVFFPRNSIIKHSKHVRWYVGCLMILYQLQMIRILHQWWQSNSEPKQYFRFDGVISQSPDVLFVEITGLCYALQMIPKCNSWHVLTYWFNVIVSRESTARKVAGYGLDDWQSMPGRGKIFLSKCPDRRPTGQETRGPRNQSGCGGEEENLRTCRESNPHHLAQGSLTTCPWAPWCPLKGMWVPTRIWKYS